MPNSQWVHDRDDTEMKENRCQASKWSSVELERHSLLMGARNKTAKWTYTHTHMASSQIRPSLVPLRHFAQLPLLGQSKPDRGEESGTEPSSCVSRGLSSVEAGGDPVDGEDENSATFYRIAMLLWCIMNQWLILLGPRLHRSHLQHPALQGGTFVTFCHCKHKDCFRRCFSESGRLTFRLSEKSQSTSNISGQERLFSFLSWDPKWDKLGTTHVPHSFTVSITLRKWFTTYSPEVKLSVCFHQ